LTFTFRFESLVESTQLYSTQLNSTQLVLNANVNGSFKPMCLPLQLTV